MNLSPGPFREDPGRSSGGSRLGGSPAAGALGSDLRDKGLEEAEEFSWEVCFSSVGISGPAPPRWRRGLTYSSQRCCCRSELGFLRPCFQPLHALVSSSPSAGIQHAWVLFLSERGRLSLAISKHLLYTFSNYKGRVVHLSLKLAYVNGLEDAVWKALTCTTESQIT